MPLSKDKILSLLCIMQDTLFQLHWSKQLGWLLITIDKSIHTMHCVYSPMLIVHGCIPKICVKMDSTHIFTHWANLID